MARYTTQNEINGRGKVGIFAILSIPQAYTLKKRRDPMLMVISAHGANPFIYAFITYINR